MHPGRGGLPVLVFALLLPGCGGDRVPAGYEPLSKHGCPNLLGDYRLEDPADAVLVLPGGFPRVPKGIAFLSIEPVGAGSPRVVLRPSPEAFDSAASELRRHDPDRYMAWRSQVLKWVDGKADSSESAIAELGPAISWTRPLANASCKDGWQSLGGMERLPPETGPDGEPLPQRYASTALSRNAAGELLLRTSLSTLNPTGFHFFGQELAYQSYEDFEWRKLSPVASAQAGPRPDETSLPRVATSRERREQRASSAMALVDIQQWLIRRVGDDTKITLFRPLQFDPAAVALEPNELRIEVAGSFPAAAEDPFQAALRTDPRVRDIVRRQHRRLPAGREYALVEFTLRF